MKAYTLSELAERARISPNHTTAYRMALANCAWALSEPNATDAELLAEAMGNGFTYNAAGEPLDGWETESDYDPSDLAAIKALEGDVEPPTLPPAASE